MDSHQRLSNVYFWYYAALGAFTPYFARWVKDAGHGALAASATLALWYATRIAAPPLWTALCERSPQPLRWLQGGAAASLVGFSGFLLFDSLVGVLLTMAVFSFFANAIMPQFEALTLDRLGAERAAYGRIRVWGSVGFLLVAGSFGALLERVGESTLPWLMLPLLGGLVAGTLLIPPAAPVQHEPSALRLRDVLARGEVRRFLLIALLMQIGFGPFYVFYTIHLSEAGQAGSAIGVLWAAGVIAEIGMFVLMARVLRRRSAAAVIALCLLVTAARWTVVALWPQSFSLMLLAQLLHALSFGAFHAACMQRIAEFFPGRLGLQGQSLLYSLSSGLGGVIGALAAGAAFEHGGGALCFALGVIACSVAAAVAVRDLRRDRKPA